MLYVSRFSNPELKSGKYTPVRISLGAPKWPLGYTIAGEIKDLMPFGLLQINDRALYEKKYRERLDRIGVDRIQAALDSFGVDKPVVLLCYEDVRDPSQWCHRTIFAQWWLENTGEIADELTDPSTGHGKLFEMVKDAKALVLCYQEKPAGEYVGDAIYARAATRKGMNAYLCSNRGEEAEALAHGKKIKRPNESALEPLPCSIMPTDYEITEDSDLKIIKVKAANTQYYRKLWTHNFVGSSATFNFAVLIDGLVAGVFGISKMTAEALFIWYVMKVPHKELRLGRLMYMLAQNRSLTDTVTNDFERERVVCVRTAMLTKYPENKEVRGIMKMTERKKDKEYGFKLTYEAPIIEGRSEKATLTEWLRREKEWQAKRNATK